MDLRDGFPQSSRLAGARFDAPHSDDKSGEVGAAREAHFK
jgi:hypothetical protein